MSYTNPYGDDANKNPEYQELYTRWFQVHLLPITTHDHPVRTSYSLLGLRLLPVA